MALSVPMLVEWIPETRQPLRRGEDRREIEKFVADTEEWFHLEWCKATAKLDKIEQILKDNNLKIKDGELVSS